MSGKVANALFPLGKGRFPGGVIGKQARKIPCIGSFNLRSSR
jgi:hypothetical protein